MSGAATLERKVYNLYSAEEAQEALRTAMQLTEQGEVFEVTVNYEYKVIEITRFFGMRTEWRPKLHVTFSINMVRIIVSGRIPRHEVEAVLAAALIDKIQLYRTLEHFAKMPALVDIWVW